MDDLDFYVPIPPQLIRPWASGRFAVYLMRKGEYVLYTNKGDAYGKEHRQKLFDMGVNKVYIPAAHRADYEYYLRENLGEILVDETITLEVRTTAWYQASLSLVKDVFDEKLPKPLPKKKFESINKLVRDTITFCNEKGALTHMIKMISKGYRDYHHGVGVLTLTNFVLRTAGVDDKELLTRCGIGAMLHDLGRTELPKELLDKNPELHSDEERAMYRSHPNLGTGLCINMPLSTQTFHCITFHHEHEDGTGFPAGLRGAAIPHYVKALVVCNAYDALTRVTGYRKALTPFEALQYLQKNLSRYDPEMIKRLIIVLSDANIEIGGY